MGLLVEQVKSCVRFLWIGLRQWSGDAAYERYVECIAKDGGAVAMSEAEFYVEELKRKYSRPNRCC
jgi:uncharacterized short protein YbdD (DUF466 family)